jgi:hypothetical protein
LKYLLTPSALTSALRSNGYLQNTEINEVQCGQIGQNLGFNGSLWRLHLNFGSDDMDVPNTLIAKFPLDSSLAEKLESEARFYGEFTGDIGIRIPRCFVANREMLLLEDLSHLKCGDAAKGCSPEEALLVVRHLAKFHATGWMKPSIVNHEWLPKWPVQPERFAARFQEFHPVFLRRFAALIPPQMNALALRLVKQIPQIVRELSEAPFTLIHRDTHLDNILFDPPDSVVLIDWPSAVVGPAAMDFARFVTPSMPTSVRQSIEGRLLSEYLEVLQNEGVRNYGMHELRRHTTLAALRIWAGMATGFGASNSADLAPRQRELQTIEIQRMLDFAEDWDFAGFLESSL